MSTLAAKKKSDVVPYCIKLVIGLFLMFGFSYICPTWSTLTREGVAAIGIFAGIIFLIVTGYGLIMPGIMGLFACIMTGAYTSASIVSSTFGGSTIFQLIMVYAVCEGLTVTGAAEFFARWIISRKFAQGKPMLFTLVFFIAAMLLGAFVSMGGIIFVYKILDSIREALDYPVESKWSKCMSLCTFVSASVGMAVIPFKGMPFIIFAPLVTNMANYGIELNYAKYLIVALVVCLIIIVIQTLFMRYVWKVDMSKIKTLDVSGMEGMQNLKMTKQQIYVSLAFLVGILQSILLLFKTAFFYPFLSSISVGVWFGLVFAIMCILRVGGEKIIKDEPTMRNSIQWGVIMTVCAFTTVGAMISSNDFGVKEWIISILNPIFGSMSFFGFMCLLIIVSVFFTNFFSNTALGIIIGTLVAPFIAEYAAQGIDPTVIGCAITMACMYAFLTMCASGTSPLFLCRPEIEKDMKFVWTKGLAIAAVGCVVMILCFTALAYIF